MAIRYVTEFTAILIFNNVDGACIVRASPGPTPDYRSVVGDKIEEQYLDFVTRLAIAGRVVFGLQDYGAGRRYFIVREGAVSFYETIEAVSVALGTGASSGLPDLVPPKTLIGMIQRQRN